MVKEMSLDLGPWSLRQHYTCAKFLVCVLLIGLSVLLLLFSSRVIGPSEEQATKPSGNGVSLFSLLLSKTFPAVKWRPLVMNSLGQEYGILPPFCFNLRGDLEFANFIVLLSDFLDHVE